MAQDDVRGHADECRYRYAASTTLRARTKSLRGSYNDPDYGLSFDNTGKNGHYPEFAWHA